MHFFSYRPPNTDKEKFFDEISVSLNKIFGKYDNIILAGDLNIDELRPCSDSTKNHLSDMKDIFGLTKLTEEPTCCKSQNSTLLDLILTNRPRTFMQSHNFDQKKFLHDLDSKLLKEIFTEIVMIHMKNFQKFLLIF